MLPAVEMALLGLMVAFTANDINAVFSTLLVACVITRLGTKFDPPPFENETASPGDTSPISTAMAPALAARSILRLTLQDPRSMRAIFPLGLARYVSAGVAPAAG